MISWIFSVVIVMHFACDIGQLARIWIFTFSWGHHHLHLVSMNDQLTSWLIHNLQHHADQTQQGRNSCPGLQFLAFSLDSIMLLPRWAFYVVSALCHCLQKFGFQQSTLLLFGAFCGYRLQKEFNRCKARSCEKCCCFQFYIGQIITMKWVKGSERTTELWSNWWMCLSFHRLSLILTFMLLEPQKSTLRML